MGLKNKIVKESLKLFTLKGFLSASLNDILRASNCSKGGFYNHFSSKEDLFFAVLNHAQIHWRERNLHHFDQIDSPVDKIKLLLENYRDRYLADQQSLPGGCPFVMLAVELADQRPHLCRELNRGFKKLKDMIRRLLEQGKQQGELETCVEADRIAEMIFSGMLGASVIYNVDKSLENLNHTINSLTAYIDDLKP